MNIWGSSPENLYACGLKGLLLHFNGKEWRKIETNTDFLLRGIWGSDESNIYISGIKYETGKGILFHYNGKRLLNISDNNPLLKDEGGIKDVWGYHPDSVLVVSGDQLLIGNYKEGWKDFPGFDGDNNSLLNVTGTGSNNIWVATYFGYINHWNGRSWHRYNQFYKKPNGDNLYGACAAGNTIVLCGFSQDGFAIVYKGIQETIN